MSWISYLRTDRPLVLPILLTAALLLLTILLPQAAPADHSIGTLVRLLPPHLEGFMDGIAWLATYPVLIVVALGWAGIELTQRNWPRAIIVVSSLGAQLLFYVVKELTHRARPVSHFVASHGLHDYSFPSGHAAGAVGVYGMVAILAADLLPRPYNRILISLIVALIIVIGIGRIYLEAHFPTDVLGGWLVGLITISVLRPFALKYRSKPGASA